MSFSWIAVPRARQTVDVLSYALVALLLGYALSVLVGTPVRGMADNGDYWRVMGPAGIVHAAPLGEARHRFVRRDFGTRSVRLGRHPSSPALMAVIARGFGPVFAGDPGGFDLRQMGFVYWLLLAGLVGLALWWRVPPLLCLALCWMIVDPRYLLFFNSFYADALTFVVLLGVTLWLIRWGGHQPEATPPRAALVVGGFLALLLLGGMTKGAHSLLPVIGMAAAARGWWRTARRQRRWLGAALVAAMALVASIPPLHFTHGTGHRFPRINEFHTVFRGIAQLSAEPERVLSRLEIPQRWWHLTGRSYFDQPESEELSRALSRVSRLSVLWLYLSEPGAAGRAARRVQAALGDGRPLWLGNYERTLKHPDRARYAPKWRATLTTSALFGWPLGFWAFLCLVGAWLVGCEIRGRAWDGTRAALWFLFAAVAVETVVAVLGDGVFSLRRHLLAAGLCLNLMLCVWLLDLLRWGQAQWRLRCGTEASRSR